jgi:hypothetical protein
VTFAARPPCSIASRSRGRCRHSGRSRVDAITLDHLKDLVRDLDGNRKTRVTIRRTLVAVAMVLDHEAIDPNRPGIAASSCPWPNRPTFARWFVRGHVSKTRRPRLVVLPDDLWQAMLDGLPPREDRHEGMALFPGVTADRLRTAIARACKVAGVPTFSPQDLRHRRITLLLKRGDLSLAEIGEAVGQRSRVVTLDTYAHVLLDHREAVRRALSRAARPERVRRARRVHTPVHTRGPELSSRMALPGGSLACVRIQAGPLRP